jgi:hypothetical protein
MRLLSVRLIVSLIVGITLVSLGFSYYEAMGERRALRHDLEQHAEILGRADQNLACRRNQWSPLPLLDRQIRRHQRTAARRVNAQCSA